MKKLIAKRRLKGSCDQCNQQILKGHVYYNHRIIVKEEWMMFSSNTKYCAKCAYKNEQREKRYEKFKKKCAHPEKFIEEIWSYIPGESVKQPDHSLCILCGEHV